MYTNVPHPCGRPGRAGDRPDQRNLSSRTTGLVSFFGSLPFRQLAGPACPFPLLAAQASANGLPGHRISIPRPVHLHGHPAVG